MNVLCLVKMMGKVPGLSKKWRLMRKIKILERTNWTQDKLPGGINRLKWECGGSGEAKASNQFLDKPHEMLVLVRGGFTWFGLKWTELRIRSSQYGLHLQQQCTNNPRSKGISLKYCVLCTCTYLSSICLVLELWCCVLRCCREGERLGVDCSFYCNKTKCWQPGPSSVISLSRGCGQAGWAGYWR